VGSDALDQIIHSIRRSLSNGGPAFWTRCRELLFLTPATELLAIFLIAVVT
jgi:hypothetical protein